MRIGIFGGSFNPPHKMHENIAASLVELNIVDKVIFVPTGSKYKYKSNLIADEDRYWMVKLITDKYDSFDVSNYELKDHVIYTFETLNHFHEIYPNDMIYFICGADNLSYIDTWKNGQYILENFKILVVKRNTDNVEDIIKRLEQYKDNIIVVDIKEQDVSSTYIRNDLTDGKEYLDEDVYQYIKEKNLYLN